MAALADGPLEYNSAHEYRQRHLIQPILETNKTLVEFGKLLVRVLGR